MFLLSIGIAFGGYIKLIGDIEKLSTKADNITADLVKIQVQNATLEGQIALAFKSTNKGVQESD